MTRWSDICSCVLDLCLILYEHLLLGHGTSSLEHPSRGLSLQLEVEERRVIIIAVDKLELVAGPRDGQVPCPAVPCRKSVDG